MIPSIHLYVYLSVYDLVTVTKIFTRFSHNSIREFFLKNCQASICFVKMDAVRVIF